MKDKNNRAIFTAYSRKDNQILAQGPNDSEVYQKAEETGIPYKIKYTAPPNMACIF